MACVLAGHRGVEWLKKGLSSSKQRCPPRLIRTTFQARRSGVAAVVIGVDPHKLSATTEVLDEQERVLGGGRFGTDRDGYRQMIAMARRWPKRVWAVEGSNGIGRHLARRLVAHGETVIDVPAKLSARARVFSTGHGRKTDATDAHSIAVVAVRTPQLNRGLCCIERSLAILTEDLPAGDAPGSSRGPSAPPEPTADAVRPVPGTDRPKILRSRSRGNAQCNRAG
jgi:hypothetical protein